MFNATSRLLIYLTGKLIPLSMVLNEPRLRFHFEPRRYQENGKNRVRERN